MGTSACVAVVCVTSFLYLSRVIIVCNDVVSRYLCECWPVCCGTVLCSYSAMCALPGRGGPICMHTD